MIVKTSDIKNKDYEYVVVGSGPAGLTVAQNIATEDKKVLLIEGGGWSYSEQSQQNYEGEVIGDDVYSVKTSRLRFFGGTSNHWGGMCRPLDTIDFTRFPIEKGDLDPYLSRASAILEIEGMFNKDIIINEDFKQVEFQSSPPVRFNKKYRKNIESSKFIDLALNISVLEIIEGKRENSVGSIRVSDDNPGDIVCYRGSKMLLSHDNKLQPYNTWPEFTSKKKSPLLFFKGKDGVLYPPGSET